VPRTSSGSLALSAAHVPAENVVRISDGGSVLSSATIRRRLAAVSAFYGSLITRGDVGVETNPVPRGLPTRGDVRPISASADSETAGWDGPIGRMTERAVTLAAGTDATEAALTLCEHARRFHLDRLGLFAGARYRLAGLLDHDPGDLVALAALGLVSLAALEDQHDHLSHRYAVLNAVRGGRPAGAAPPRPPRRQVNAGQRARRGRRRGGRHGVGARRAVGRLSAPDRRPDTPSPTDTPPATWTGAAATVAGGDRR
jgi:hypothetical protein